MRTVKKNGVVFVDLSEETKKTIEGLEKTALRASGKVIRKYIRKDLPIRTKRIKNHVGSWVKIDYATGNPVLQIGFYSWQKVKAKGKQPSHASPHWIEFGTESHDIRARRAKVMAHDNISYGKLVNHPGQGAAHVLRDTVLNNIDEIKKAQEQYIAEINKTLDEAGAVIYKGEDTDEDD